MKIFTASTDIIRLNMYSFTQWKSVLDNPVSLLSVDLRQAIANLILPERSLERIIVCQLVDVLQSISTNERRKERRYEGNKRAEKLCAVYPLIS